MYIEIGKRISHNELTEMGNISAQTKLLRARYVKHLNYIHMTMSTVKELTPIVLDRYRYKGREIEISAKKTLKELLKQANKIQGRGDTKEFIVSDQSGQGELALLLALMYPPDCMIYCHIASSESREVLDGCKDDFVRNVRIIDSLDIDSHNPEEFQIYVVTKDNKGLNQHCDLDRAITLMC